MSFLSIRSCFVAATFFLCLHGTLLAYDTVLENENLIGSRAVEKIVSIGAELKEKTGVNAYILALESVGKKSLVSYEKDGLDKLEKPYVLLSLVKNEHQVDIVCSDELKGKFDKEQILSPYPWSGTIIPILTAKKGKDKYSAALLNGYADLTDQIAKSYEVELASSIGNANKNVLGIIRTIFYASMIAVFLVWLYWRIRRRARAKN